MNEASVTFQGWVGNDIVHRDTARGSVAHFRVGSTPRIRKSTGEWVDGPTSWFSVTCWRALADHVRDSLHKGEPVLVHGRLRTDVWERADGQSSVTYVVEATYVGHDLSRGTASFVRVARPERGETEDEAEQVLRELVHDAPGDLPQLDSLGQRRSADRVA
ncbi:MAG TPA: single-stranded DNA-binding protein [Nocardioidaceae bacterium]|nr:single-stranded DNA-binding protein [Nocardioidaceae bacterium]